VIWLIYNVLLVLSSPIWVPWMILRSKRRKEAPNWRERAGDYEVPRRRDRKRVWVHAVSVGEVKAAEPILRELRALLPDFEIALTATTSTGYGLARSLQGTVVDYVFYFPVDVPRFCVNALLRVEPCVVAVLETELWLNFLQSARSLGARTCLLNARISDRSFRRARYLRWFYRSVFRHVEFCGAQSEQDAERLRYLGAQEVQVLGNSKFDEAPPARAERSFRDRMGVREGEALIVVGSVRGEEEEDFVLDALQGLPVRVLFAPRHVERAGAIQQKAGARGFEVGLRSREEWDRPFVILDTIGELAGAYEGADLAIVGGGFSPSGGQNLIQPMAVGVPTLCGPHMSNFREVFESAQRVGAVAVASSPEELRETVQRLLADGETRARMGAAGKDLVERNRGSSRRYAEVVARLAQEFFEERERRRAARRG